MADAPAGVEFVPIAWGCYGNADNSFVNDLNTIKNQEDVHRLLSFDEPDGIGQDALWNSDGSWTTLGHLYGRM